MAAEPSINAYRAGMELDEPSTFTPPATRHSLPKQDRYTPPRFSRPVRVVITGGMWLIPGLLMLQAVMLALTGGTIGDGRVRAAAVLFLMPLVPAAPLLIRATRDLWGWESIRRRPTHGTPHRSDHLT
jgi:hypothetical protein